MNTFFFSLKIHQDAFQAYYTGQARRVSVVAENGKRLELPAHVFRPFVNHQGVTGRFKVTIDDQYRLIQLERV
ncbi:DUF2835 family protein [Thiospirillum jenense]|uniref:DUF2835 domain-containing protein n=1 Tax=Thiospirillum jenense TaxID=1653858 RepID=A0A839H8J5_9GAMM|nr:DUF2835 family protein [Thiospirillum jenense]MBB1125324.1 DUF2835 domain-containing protein [Thiospirillum jenense]